MLQKMQTNLYKPHLESKSPNRTSFGSIIQRFPITESHFDLECLRAHFSLFLHWECGSSWSKRFSFSQDNLVYLNSTFVEERWKLLRKVRGFGPPAFCWIIKKGFGFKRSASDHYFFPQVEEGQRVRVINILY